MLGGKRGGFTIVSNEDFAVLNKFKWSQNAKGYVRRCSTIKGTVENVRMQRHIMEATKGVQIDHRNHCPYDNTRRNLRPSTHAENQRNRLKETSRLTSSKFKGIHWDKDRLKWMSKIRINGVSTNLGRFNDEKEAALAYNEAARKHYGEFANVNSV